jgi:hypothetical protein
MARRGQVLCLAHLDTERYSSELTAGPTMLRYTCTFLNKKTKEKILASREARTEEYHFALYSENKL